MTDYGHELSFGTFLTPAATDVHRVVDLAVLTEQVGLDLVTVQDHPYQAKFVDTWTLLSFVAARTQRVTVAPNVANLPLRPPAVLAKSVASLDLLTGGRVELGLGSGGFREAIAAYGGPELTPSASVDALAEGIAVIRAVWAAPGTVREVGQHYAVDGAHAGPAPAHDVGIWVGAYKPRMLRLTGELADGWLPSSGYLGPEGLGDANAAIDEAATAAGRSPADVRRVYNLWGRFDGDGSEFLQGPPAVWVEQLAELAIEHGMSTFVLGSDDPDDIRRFAAEVVPAVRALVDAERARATSPASRAADQESSGEDPHARGDGEASPTGPVPLRSSTGPQTSATLPAAGLDVVPTPDDGTRLSDVRLWDESTRPTGPTPEAGRTYTAHEQAAGRHLVDVHDALRGELTRLRELVRQVEATRGEAEVIAARSHIASMTLRQNDWTLGVYCAQYCRVVTGHHSLEDQSVFPYLRERDPRLAPVIDRLEQEHVVIADVLERVDAALVRLVSEPDGVAAVQGAIDLLTDTLLSHLSYEERELVEPLARLGFG